MNGWAAVSLALLGAFALSGAACFRGSAPERLVGLESAGISLTLLLVTAALATGRASFVDLAMAAAVLSFGGGLVFARFLERWL